MCKVLSGWSIGLVISTILPHRPAAGGLDAGEQLHPPCPAAAAVVAHLGDDVADRHSYAVARVCASFSIRSLPQRPHVMRMNYEGNALTLVGFCHGSRRRCW